MFAKIAFSALLALSLVGCGSSIPGLNSTSTDRSQANLFGYRLHQTFVGVDPSSSSAQLWFTIKNNIGRVASDQKGKPVKGANAILKLKQGQISGRIFLAQDGGMYFKATKFSSHEPEWEYYGKFLKVGTHRADSMPTYLDSLEASFDRGVHLQFKNDTGWLSTGPSVVITWDEIPPAKSNVSLVQVKNRF